LLHESSWDELVMRKGEGKEAKSVVFQNMGSHSLKGIHRRVHIIQAIPSALSSRGFPQIKTKSNKLATKRRADIPSPTTSGEKKLEAYLDSVCNNGNSEAASARTAKQIVYRKSRKVASSALSESEQLQVMPVVHSSLDAFHKHGSFCTLLLCLRSIYFTGLLIYSRHRKN
jgi:hypothetical protein